MKVSPDSSLSQELFTLLHNALFPGGHPLLSHSIRCAHAEAIWSIASLRPFWSRLERGQHEHRRLWKLRPSSEQARVRVANWAAEQGFPAEMALHEFLEQNPPDSPAEEAFVRDVFFPRFGKAGLVCLKTQVPFQRVHGGQGRIDFALMSEDGSRRLAVEIDGKKFHGLGMIGTEQFEDDRLRENELKIAGWQVMRFAASTVFQRPALCAEQLSQMMAVMGIELPETTVAPVVAGLEDKALEAWLLQRWKGSIAPIQQHLLRWVSESPLPSQLQVCFPAGHVGAMPLALFDFFETLEACCSMLGEEMPVEEIDLTIYEPNEEQRSWSQQLIQGFWHNREAQLWRGWRSFRGGFLRWRIRLEAQAEPMLDSRDLDWMLFPPAKDEPLPLFARRQQKNKKQTTLFDRAPLEWKPQGGSSTKAISLAKASPASARSLVERWFRYDRFRTGQWLLLRRILRGDSVLGVLPSGLGKSLCYQWPALWLPGVTLVVSPLTSLIREQVERLVQWGFSGVESITGDILPDAQERALQRLERGECKLLFVAPERLQEGSFVRALEKVTAQSDWSWRSFVIDEAHCASQWSTDFRNSYLRLPTVLKGLDSKVPRLLLTSTATEHVHQDLLRLFELESSSLVQLPEFERLETSLTVHKTRNEQARWREVQSLFKTKLPLLMGQESLQELHGSEQSIANGDAQAGLVLVPYRGNADGSVSFKSEVSLRARPLAKALAEELDVETSAYVGTRDPEQSLSEFLAHKHSVQQRFQEHSLPLVVATRGVGAGLSPERLRYVVETTTPSTMEQYAQNVRRAGRDGEDAHHAAFWIPRARECQGERPPCVERWECPYLDNLCSLGVQATFLWNEQAPLVIEQRDLMVLLQRYFVPLLKQGGRISVPLKLSYSTLQPAWPEQEPLEREELTEFLSTLKQWRWIRNYHWAGELQGFQLTSSSHRLLTSEILQQYKLEEDGADIHDQVALTVFLAQRLLEWDASKAERLGFFVYDVLRGRDGRSQVVQLNEGKDTQRTFKTERLLVVLRSLGLVRWYEKEEGEWLVQVRSYQRRRTFEHLEEALHFLDDEDREARLEHFRDFTRGKGRLKQVLWLCEQMQQSVRDTYHRQHWRALETVEEFCENREKECRTQRLRRLLDAEYVPPSEPEPCGRCDVCGIQPLSEVKPQMEPAVEERLKMGLGWIKESFDQFNFARLQQIVDLFEQLGLLSLLRDRCLQGLQKRPESVFGLLGVTYAYHRLGDSRRAERASRALVRACLRQERPHQLDAVLRWLPLALLAPLLQQMATPLTESLGRGKFHSLLCDLYLEEGQEHEARALWLETLREQTRDWQEIPSLSDLRKSLAAETSSDSNTS